MSTNHRQTTGTVLVVAKIVARVAGVPVDIRTVHGFPLHEGMPRGQIMLYQLLERIGTLISTAVLSQSIEDVETTARLGFRSKIGGLIHYWEDGNHPRLTVGVLPGAVDVCIAQGGAAQAVFAREKLQVVFPGEFADPVGRHRRWWLLLVRRFPNVAIKHPALTKLQQDPRSATIGGGREHLQG